MKPKIPEGAKVFIRHYRYTNGYIVHPLLQTHQLMPAKAIREEGLEFLPNGGMTEVNITMPDGKEVVGLAVCSESDKFNKNIGRMIATGRALKKLN